MVLNNIYLQQDISRLKLVPISSTMTQLPRVMETIHPCWMTQQGPTEGINTNQVQGLAKISPLLTAR